uniref:uncharacterized protein LOC100178097 isoform X2 n=1 Tax=Ciona intestinalis TaxID=7719 RepID=UPI000EF4D5EC|nr:uncharacterized protein LOC100178097 isoform X2 [Ciona intestinalis]|eukprot:XP_026690377.1 uncharacterized protein LOC100178097 isoform X2 [Ciona intestinalis]
MTIHSTTKTQHVKFDYKMCLSSMPYYIKATASPKYSTGVEKFNVTVVQINFYNAVLELERIDQDSGWGEMLFTVQWTIYHISDYITSTATVQYRVDYDTDIKISETSRVSEVHDQGLSKLPALQNNTHLQPRLSQERQNGHRFLVFDKMPNRLITNLDLNPKQGENDLVTVFMVYRIDSHREANVHFPWRGLFGADNTGWDKFIASSIDILFVSGAVGDMIQITSTLKNANPSALHVWNVLSVQWNVDGGVNASSVWCNGKLLQRFQAKTTPSDTKFIFGSISRDGIFYLHGAIGEFVLFKDIIITDDVMKKYHLHFIEKWGIEADPILV